MPRDRIYLDNAATSYPKPPAVYEAVDHYQRNLGAAVGRGTSNVAGTVNATVERCRTRAARILGTSHSQNVAFTFNGTDSLNQALYGVLRSGDHVVTTGLEHNSVIRPLRTLMQRRGIELDVLPVEPQGRLDPARVRAVLRSNTRLVATIHASNVTGVVQPIAEIGEVARRHGSLHLVDAAQTAGHLPFRIDDLPVDLLACPGHKGLFGPLGTGLLFIHPNVVDVTQSTRQGGTGSVSEQEEQPGTLPDKYESGNHNAPGLFGLEAGLAFLEERTVDAVHAHERSLLEELLEGLRSIPNITTHAADLDHMTGVLSLNLEGLDPHTFATILDDEFGIETRAGLHCAPSAHRFLGTLETGGTVRMSPGALSTSAQIAVAIDACREIARNVL